MVNLVLKDNESKCKFVETLYNYFCDNEQQYKKFQTNLGNLSENLSEKERENELNQIDKNNQIHITNIMSFFLPNSANKSTTSFSPTLQYDQHLAESVIAIYEHLEDENSKKMNLFINDIKLNKINTGAFFGNRGEYNKNQEYLDKTLLVNVVKSEHIVDYRFMNEKQQKIIQGWFKIHHGKPPEQVEIIAVTREDNLNVNNGILIQ